MATSDPRVDAYITKAPAFAQPVLTELRARVHAACPDVVETIKWGAPAFECAGLLAGMAAFKAHCGFNFWKEKLLRGEPAHAAVVDRCGRLARVADLPQKAAFAKALRRAAQLNAAGTAVPRGPSTRKPALPVPADFARALAADRAAKACFDAFPPSHRREYLEWIVEAKKDETRQRRIAQAIEWIAAGKHRHWKYDRC